MNDTIRPRRPLLALVMSLVLPGFGQLYNGEVNKAIWIFLAFSLVTVGITPFVALHITGKMMMPALVAGLFLTLAIWVYSMRDAWRTAARSQEYVPQQWQKSSLYAATFILLFGLLLPSLSELMRDRQIESFRIPPASNMLPTVMPGDLVFADKRYNCHRCGQAVVRGDIVVFTHPNNRTLYYLNRVIGLPGERIEVRNGEVRINGRSLAMHGAGATGSGDREGDGPRQWRVSWAETRRVPDTDLIVPAGQVFLMGDNRNRSEDSQVFGPVPLRDVVGKLRQVWFSAGDGHVRWNRMGLVLE